MVRAALVAQREVDEKAAIAAEPTDSKPKPSSAGLDPGKIESPAGVDASAAGPVDGKTKIPPAESGTAKAMPARSSEVVPTKKMMQHPVYFVSSLLQGARSRYSGVQKLLFGLLMALRKLRHYFQAHEITVVTRLHCNGYCIIQMQRVGL